MYLRHTTRRKDGKTHVYWQLVRSVRRGRKVVQETVTQLGELDAEGRRQRFELRSFAVAPEAGGQVIDLMEALRASLEKKPAKRAQPAKPAARKAAKK